MPHPGANILILAADAVLAVHALYVAFVVLGFAAILWGAIRRRRWVRNPMFRYSHLGAIGIVVIQALAGIPCPLTVWERELRRAAGQSASQLPFIPRLLQELIFYQAPPEVFTVIYVVFGTAVALTVWLVPPRRSRHHQQQQ